WAAPPLVTPRRPVDLDDVRAHVAQDHRGERPRQVCAQIEHAQAAVGIRQTHGVGHSAETMAAEVAGAVRGPDQDRSLSPASLKRAGRLSRAAAMPSFRSSVWLIVATAQKLACIGLPR